MCWVIFYFKIIYQFFIVINKTFGLIPFLYFQFKYKRYGIISVKKIQLKVFSLNSNGNVALSSPLFIMSLCRVLNPVNSNIFIQSPSFLYQYQFHYITLVKKYPFAKMYISCSPKPIPWDKPLLISPLNGNTHPFFPKIAKTFDLLGFS